MAYTILALHIPNFPREVLVETVSDLSSSGNWDVDMILRAIEMAYLDRVRAPSGNQVFATL